MVAVGRVVGVVSGKGGVGKTTLTINIGAALAREYSKRTVLVDCNIGTSHLSVCLGMHQWPVTLSEVLDGTAKLSDALARDAASGMMVLPASLKAENITPRNLSRLRPLAAKLAETFDFVLLDGSPGIGVEAKAALEAADELLYISSPTTPSVMDIVRLRHLVAGMRKKELGVVLNLCHPDANQLSPQDVNRMVDLEVIAQVPFDIKVERSLSEQSSAVVAYPNSPASLEINALAAKLAGAYKPKAKKEGIGSRIDRHLGGLKEFVGI